MNRMIQRLGGAVAFSGVVGAFGITGCAPVDPEDTEEQVSETQQPQLDTGESVWRSLTLTFDDTLSSQLATIYVFKQALGGYVTGTEYWHINLKAVSLIGQYSLNIVTTNQGNAGAPASSVYAAEQAFTLPEFPTSGWGTWWSKDPVSGGSLYNGPNDISLRLTKTKTPTSVSSVTWYQVITSNATPYNITPNGAFTLAASGSSVSVPFGYRGYDVSQVP